MASPRSIEVKVGVLILTAAFLLAAFILVMGGVNFQPTYSIFVDFDNPGGLQSGAPVKIAGVKVGKIAEIRFRGGVDPRTGKREALVRLRALIETQYKESVHENSLFYVTNQSVLGEQFLAIEPGSSDRPVLAEGSAVRGLDPPRLDMLIAEMYDLLHSTVSTLHENKAEIGEAFDGLRKTLKGTGELMERNKEHLDKIVENVREDHRRRRRPGQRREGQIRREPADRPHPRQRRAALRRRRARGAPAPRGRPGRRGERAPHRRDRGRPRAAGQAAADPRRRSPWWPAAPRG